MLVLTRRLDEAIVIDGQVRVIVTSIGHGKVRLAIDAPAAVQVDRSEVHDRRMREIAPNQGVLACETR
jgi:carbon storage regulator